MRLLIFFLILGISIEFLVIIIPQLNTRGFTFTEVLDSVGIQRPNKSAGVSWVDYDNDSKLDIFIAGSQIKLHHNNGDGNFTDFTKEAGLDIGQVYTTGIFGDYDNDGCSDLFMANKHGDGTPHVLYSNNCDGTFTEVKN